MLNENNFTFYVIDKCEKQISFLIEVYRDEKQIYLSERDAKDYLLAGKRKNKNRIKRYEEGKQIIIKSRVMLLNFVQDAIEGMLPDTFAVYGRVDEKLAKKINDKSLGMLNVKDSYLELSANDLFHANKHSYAVEEGDIDLSLEDIVYSLENIEQGIVEKAIQRKNGENVITISFPKSGGRIILIELYSKSAGSLRFKTEWAISEEKYVQKYKSSSNSAGS